MAIRILEFGALGQPAHAPVRRVPFLAKQSGAVGGTSTQSSAFSAGTSLVTVQADEDCHVAFGSNPTATTSDFKIGAGETHDFGVNSGDKAAWIAA